MLNKIQKKMETQEIKETRQHVSTILRKWRAKTNGENWSIFPDTYFAKQLGVSKSQFSQYLNCVVTMPLPVYLRLCKIVPKECLN